MPVRAPRTALRIALGCGSVALTALALVACGGSGTDGATATTIVITTKPPPAAVVEASIPASDADSPGGGDASTSTSTSTTASASTTASVGEAPDSVNDAATAAPSPGLLHLQGALVKSLRPAAAQTGALVYDLTADAKLFALHANVGRPPASLEKLYTTIAAATLLGRQTTFPTQVLGSGHLGPHGVWYGNLYLRGDGDPTFGDGTFNRIDEDGYGPTAAQLVAQLRHDGIRRVTGEVIGDESRFDRDRGGPATDNQPDVPDYFGELSALVYDHGATTGKLSPAAFAARELVLTMRAAGISARTALGSGRTPQDAQGLATVNSPPLSVLLRLMDVPSDDLFADLLAKQLGYRFASSGTLAAGAQQIDGVIAGGYGLHPTILDGSGLDKSDRSSPTQLVTLLSDVWPTSVGQLLAASLPVVGESGTVQTIGVHTAAQGRCIAKTGTLNYVTNLAGYCHARGGHLLVFAVFIDGPGNWTALQTMNSIVGAIAAY